MTSRERLLTVLRGEIPDCVPVAPDFSNMIPAKLTGKPWWDIYLYNDPPIFEAYVECAKKFDIDSLMDSYFPFQYPWQVEEEERFEQENPPLHRRGTSGIHRHPAAHSFGRMVQNHRRLLGEPDSGSRHRSGQRGASGNPRLVSSAHRGEEV